MEVRTELIVDLREKFLKKLEDEGSPDSKGFHPADIARVKNSDDWLRRFLEHNENNVQESLNMLWETCSWRKKFGTNDITEENIRKDYLEDGSFFSYGKDKDGKALFIVKSKLHVKGAKDFSELQRCIVYWFERLETEGNGSQISLFFDMAEAGLSNVDMEFTKYLIGLFKSYYPNFLNYIIIFEMPWVLNAAFKIIKSWLPAKAIPKIKFVNKNNLKELIDPNDVMKCWGGTNDYTFTFVSKAQNNLDATMNGKLDKKVHFAEGSPLTEQSPNGFGDQTNEEQLLSVEPEAIMFNHTGNEIIGTFTLKNTTSDKPLCYKVKTTSPVKFRVRHSRGILSPNEEHIVTVVLQPDYYVRGLWRGDGFLVMCLPLKDSNMSEQELAAIWKSGKPMEQHRLKCCDGRFKNKQMTKSQSALLSGSFDSDQAADILSSKVSEDNILLYMRKQIQRLDENNVKLRNELNVSKYLILLSMIITILAALVVVYILRT